MIKFKSLQWIAFTTVILGCCQYTNSVAVMSVDLGSEWMKIGIVSPGVPMEIVLNKESKRKTPVAISFRDGERLIGEDALNVAVRFPPNAYLYFMDLLGKKIDNPIVQLFQKRFPYYNLVADETRDTVLFKHDSETSYSPEELLGMVLSKCREYAQDFARQPVKEAVITVPPYFNQAERRAVINAAELSGVKVLQLMNSNTAAALNYGIFRRKDFNETSQNILLYDMGASSTVATVVSYQIAKTKEKGMVETNPQVAVLGVGYDRTLGGLEMQLRLRDFLARAFNDMKKTPTDIFTNHRAMAKLFKEAGRLKNVLSANADHYAQVEGLLDEKDFRLQVSRDEFEKLCADLFERVQSPVEQALNNAAITMDLIDQVILVGAGTRVPKVQTKLSEFVQRELGKSLNTDESAAMGAVYKAADLSSGFKVKKFITKDAVLFPILVDFEREIDGEDGTRTLKIIRRTLFSLMNPYPQKKILTFNKHVSDFTFYVSYGELAVSAQEAAAVGSHNITRVDLSGVAAAIEKNSAEGVESKGVKAHFSMDESGIFALNMVESVFEKNSTESDAPEADDTLSKIGSAFSKLFSGASDDKVPTNETEEEGAKTNEEGIPKQDSEEGEGSQPDTLNATSGEDKTTDKESTDDKKKDENVPSEKLNSSATPTEPKKPKTVVVKETLGMTTQILDIFPLDGDTLKISTDKLKTLDEADRLRGLKEKARNVLESFVVDLQGKIYSPEYEPAITDEEKEKISATCTEISDWLYEDGADADKGIYEDKFKSLKLMTKDLSDRVREHKDRPDALDALDKMLNISQGFLDSSKGVPEDQQFFTEVEINTLDKLVTETNEWREKKLAEQENTPLTQSPALTIRMIAEKIDALDREVKYMVNKARVNKLKKQREESAAKEKEAENKTAEGEDTSKDKLKTDEQTKAEKSEDKNTESQSESLPESESKIDKDETLSSDNADDSVSPSKTEEQKHTEL